MDRNDSLVKVLTTSTTNNHVSSEPTVYGIIQNVVTEMLRHLFSIDFHNLIFIFHIVIWNK